MYFGPSQCYSRRKPQEGKPMKNSLPSLVLIIFSISCSGQPSPGTCSANGVAGAGTNPCVGTGGTLPTGGASATGGSLSGGSTTLVTGGFAATGGLANTTTGGLASTGGAPNNSCANSGASQCKGQQVQTCISGQWLTVQTCPYGCTAVGNGASCTGTCIPSPRGCYTQSGQVASSLGEVGYCDSTGTFIPNLEILV